MTHEHTPFEEEDDRLRAENEFLKMKLMLEKGAKFGNMSDMSLPPEIENVFLNNIMEFEKQAEKQEYKKVEEQLDNPAHFKPVNEIPDAEIDQAWNELSVYLNDHGINLDACSPNVTSRELYRFTLEELFKEEMSIINMPGMMHCFIYDEFHPDPIYENSNKVEYHLFHDIFSNRELFFEIDYAEEGFTFNGKKYNKIAEYKSMINRFKSFFDDILLEKCKVDQCMILENTCEVAGYYVATAIAKDSTSYSGGFRVILTRNDLEYWNFSEISIEGFDPS